MEKQVFSVEKEKLPAGRQFLCYINDGDVQNGNWIFLAVQDQTHLYERDGILKFAEWLDSFL
ncbi:hypothetical protein UR08_05565 [Listeria kieliensis]|uniref:Uncharacterized protein n=1 Tax=Listeria kieliensis TaxID=1621700 RepID=A0A3D8TVD8_9LIST|nr:hypothetical protein UR08_05565 [Listeria kieliensis]